MIERYDFYVYVYFRRREREKAAITLETGRIE
jgi:hypothetical protein